MALWREGLLAKAVLEGKTRGYTHHPQLKRFREHPDPLAAIQAYLKVVLEEAGRRGYRFDPSKVAWPGELEQGPQKKAQGLLKQEKGVQKQLPTQREQVDRPQRIERVIDLAPILLTSGQLAYEWDHLLDKLKTRDPDRCLHLKQLARIDPHPLMRVIPGPRAPWEIVR